MRWGKNRRDRIDPDELSRKADNSLRETRSKQGHVNMLTGWLKGRENQNGFGEDFEISLIPKEAK